MKIVKIIGGLGNQMFQYALAIALQERWKDEEIKLDLHGFNGYHKHQGYQLDILFGHRFEAATLTDVAQLAWPYPHYQLWRVGSRLLPKRRSMLCEPSKGLLPSDVLKQRVVCITMVTGKTNAISRLFARKSWPHSSFPTLQIGAI